MYFHVLHPHMHSIYKDNTYIQVNIIYIQDWCETRYEVGRRNSTEQSCRLRRCTSRHASCAGHIRDWNLIFILLYFLLYLHNNGSTLNNKVTEPITISSQRSLPFNNILTFTDTDYRWYLGAMHLSVCCRCNCIRKPLHLYIVTSSMTNPLFFPGEKNQNRSH